jgi:hypothetical protein
MRVFIDEQLTGPGLAAGTGDGAAKICAMAGAAPKGSPFYDVYWRLCAYATEARGKSPEEQKRLMKKHGVRPKSDSSGPLDILEDIGGAIVDAGSAIVEGAGAIVDVATNPQKLLAEIPGIGELAKYIPSIPNPVDTVTKMTKAVASGDLDQIKSELVDVAQETADMVSMVPGVGNVIGGPLSAALALIEGGSALKVALRTLLSQVPGIPPQIRDVLRTILDAVADIVEKEREVTDILLAQFKRGAMAQIRKVAPPPIVSVAGDLLSGAVQLIAKAKPIKNLAVETAEEGLRRATAAKKSPQKIAEARAELDKIKRARVETMVLDVAKARARAERLVAKNPALTPKSAPPQPSGRPSPAPVIAARRPPALTPTPATPPPARTPPKLATARPAAPPARPAAPRPPAPTPRAVTAALPKPAAPTAAPAAVARAYAPYPSNMRGTLSDELDARPCAAVAAG